MLSIPAGHTRAACCSGPAGTEPPALACRGQALCLAGEAFEAEEAAGRESGREISEPPATRHSGQAAFQRARPHWGPVQGSRLREGSDMSPAGWEVEPASPVDGPVGLSRSVVEGSGLSLRPGLCALLSLGACSCASGSPVPLLFLGHRLRQESVLSRFKHSRAPCASGAFAQALFKGPTVPTTGSGSLVPHPMQPDSQPLFSILSPTRSLLPPHPHWAPHQTSTWFCALHVAHPHPWLLASPAQSTFTHFCLSQTPTHPSQPSSNVPSSRSSSLRAWTLHKAAPPPRPSALSGQAGRSTKPRQVLSVGAPAPQGGVQTCVLALEEGFGLE